MSLLPVVAFLVSIIASSLFQQSAAFAMTNQNLLAVIGLNSALQKRFVIQNHGDLIPGNVHRASHVQTGVGGKGQDVAIALNCLGTEAIRLVQFVGKGGEGDIVHQLLQNQLGTEAIEATTVRVQSPMRTCTSIVGGSETTELVEPSGMIQQDEIQTLLESCDAALQRKTSGICIMGSMPPGCGSYLYSEIYQRITLQTHTLSLPSVLCVIDSVVGIEPLFGVLMGPTIYKVNAQELYSLVGVPPETTLSETIAAFVQKYQPPKYLQALAITDGKRPAHLCCLGSTTTTTTTTTNEPWQIFTLSIPKLTVISPQGNDKVVLYPIGAGDAVAAGTLAAWMNLQTNAPTLPPSCGDLLLTRVESLQQQTQTSKEISILVASLSFGLACGSASCLQEENSVLKLPDVMRLFNEINCE